MRPAHDIASHIPAACAAGYRIVPAAMRLELRIINLLGIDEHDVGLKGTESSRKNAGG
jgi:hypothetical protein